MQLIRLCKTAKDTQQLCRSNLRLRLWHGAAAATFVAGTTMRQSAKAKMLQHVKSTLALCFDDAHA